MKSIVWVGADGVEWPLSGPGVRGVVLEDGGLGDVVGGFDGDTKAPRGVEFDVDLVFASDTRFGAHGEAWRIFSEFCEGCSAHRAGVFVLVDSERDVVELPCVVSRVPVLARPNLVSGAFRGSFRFWARGGVWLARRHATTSSVTVTNPGDVMVWPKIRWKGAGGQVTAPSGATFTLPPTKDYRIINLDPSSSCEVTDTHGTLDADLWRKLWGVFGEGVPVGEARTYTLPKGAEMMWSVGYFNPWR